MSGGGHNTAPSPARHAHEVPHFAGEADLTPEALINSASNPYAEQGYGLQQAMGRNQANLQGTGKSFQLQDGVPELLRLADLVREGRSPSPKDDEVLGYVNTLTQNNDAESRVNIGLLEQDLGISTPRRARNATPGSAQDIRDRANNRAQNVLIARDSVLREHAEAQQRGDFAAMASLQEQASTLWNYHTNLKEKLTQRPDGTEVSNFTGSFLAEEALAGAGASQGQRGAQAQITGQALAKMHTAESWLQTETKALQTLGRFFPATPANVTAENTPPDPDLVRVSQLTPDQQRAVQEQHDRERGRLAGVRKELQESREAYADRNSTLFKRIGGSALRALKVGVHYAKTAKHNRDINLQTNDNMSPEKKAAIIARRATARRQGAPEKPISEKERYRNAANAYYEEVAREAWASPGLTNEQRSQLRGQAAANEMKELRIETNRRAQNTMIAKANRWMLEHKKTTIAIALGVTAVTGGWGGLLVGAKLSAALIGSAKLDTMMRGKIKHDDKWLEHATENMKDIANRGGDFNAMMEKGINKYRGAVALEMGKRALSTAGGGFLMANWGIPAAIDAGGSMFDYMFDSKTYDGISGPFNRLIPDISIPSASDIWETMDEATTPTTPDGSYGARAMSQRIGMN